MKIHFLVFGSSFDLFSSRTCTYVMQPNILRCETSTPVSVINVTHIICEQCFYTSLYVINVNNLNNALTLIQA
jgi:hypothetical protein